MLCDSMMLFSVIFSITEIFFYSCIFHDLKLNLKKELPDQNRDLGESDGFSFSITGI